MNNEVEQRVWVHKKTGQLGYALIGTALGDVWIFDDHSDTEVLSKRFCNFINDPLDPESYSKKEFIDLGPL
jgi:hypothetical protein